MAIFNKKVLVLNRHFAPINTITLDRAINRMNSSKNPYSAICIEYGEDEIGNPDKGQVLDFRAMPWEEWVKLSPRKHDEYSLRTSSLNIRAPQVIITHNFNKTTFSGKLKPTNDNLFEVYGGKDYWTGKQLTRGQISKDHVISKDEWRRLELPGSYDQWSNLALTEKRINFLKGNMNPKDFEKKFGYSPQYKLHKQAPEKVRRLNILRDIMPIDWEMFIFS